MKSANFLLNTLSLLLFSDGLFQVAHHLIAMMDCNWKMLGADVQLLALIANIDEGHLLIGCAAVQAFWFVMHE